MSSPRGRPLQGKTAKTATVKVLMEPHKKAELKAFAAKYGLSMGAVLLDAYERSRAMSEAPNPEKS